MQSQVHQYLRLLRVLLPAQRQCRVEVSDGSVGCLGCDGEDFGVEHRQVFRGEGGAQGLHEDLGGVGWLFAPGKEAGEGELYGHLSIAMDRLPASSPFSSPMRSATARHTLIISPALPQSSAAFLQSIKSFEAGEFTIAHSLSFLDSDYCSSSETSDEAKLVTFVTRTGEGESSPEFLRKTKRLEAGEYRRVRGAEETATGGDTPKKPFVARMDEIWKLRRTANKARLRHRSNGR